MSWLDKLLNGVCNPKKGKKPKFHNTISPVANPPSSYTPFIISGETPGWFKLDDEPITTKMWIPSQGILIELSGRYVEFGIGFAVELKEEQSWIPSEWIGLRVKFV